MSSNSDCEALREGYNAFYINIGTNICKICPYNEVGEERTSFFAGWYKAQDEHITKLTAGFRTELDKLCEKYKVDISTGCGCCGGATIQDADENYWEFSI